MFITTRDGKKIRLNEEDVKAAEDKNGGINFIGKPVAVCNEGDRMRKIWIVTVEQDKKAHNYRSFKGEMDLEFLAEINSTMSRLRKSSCMYARLTAQGFMKPSCV